jgi:hypothetical protein
MKRFRVLGLTLVAVVVIASVLSATAFALPELLGQAASEEYKSKNTVENPTWETVAGESLSCKAETGSGKQTNDTSGTFSIGLTGCKAVTGIGSFACNSAGDAKEVVLLAGTADYVWDATPKTGTVGILLLLTKANVECTALVKLKFKGHLICSIGKPLTISVSHEVACTGSKGKQTITRFFNDEEKEVTGQHLEISKNGGAFEEASLLLTSRLEFTKEVAFMNE